MQGVTLREGCFWMLTSSLKKVGCSADIITFAFQTDRTMMDDDFDINFNGYKIYGKTVKTDLVDDTSNTDGN